MPIRRAVDTMSLKLILEVSEADLRHFKKEMRKARRSVRSADDEQIIRAADDVFEQLKGNNLPDFVAQRLAKLKAMVQMVQDADWALPTREKNHVMAALAYFCDPDDLIPDDVPALGFLDDAIMVELVLGELKHENEAYAEFCSYRDSYHQRYKADPAGKQRMARLINKRKQLHARMRRRNERDRQRVKGSSTTLLW